MWVIRFPAWRGKSAANRGNRGRIDGSVRMTGYPRLMLSDLLALLDNPMLLLIVLAIGAAIGIGVERLVEGQKHAERRAYWQGRNAKPKRGSEVTPIKPEKQ